MWDFDWTMVEDNSDTWVVERLGAKPDFQRLQKVSQHVGIGTVLLAFKHIASQNFQYTWLCALVPCHLSAAADLYI